jgi:hypothetical protein
MRIIVLAIAAIVIAWMRINGHPSEVINVGITTENDAETAVPNELTAMGGHRPPNEGGFHYSTLNTIVIRRRRSSEWSYSWISHTPQESTHEKIRQVPQSLYQPDQEEWQYFHQCPQYVFMDWIRHRSQRVHHDVHFDDDGIVRFTTQSQHGPSSSSLVVAS